MRISRNFTARVLGGFSIHQKPSRGTGPMIEIRFEEEDGDEIVLEMSDSEARIFAKRLWVKLGMALNV